MKSKIVVIGLGRSGIGAARLLNSEGQEVIILESSKNPRLKSEQEALKREGIQVETGKPLELLSFQPWLDQIKSVVISPAIPWDHKTLDELRMLGVEVKGEINIAWERLKHFPWVGITGTNGKTTVTHMLRHVLELNKLNAPMGGNVGISAAEIALEYREKTKQPDWLIMELSSYQLETAPEISPTIGIWTNLTPDHLERHKTLETYSHIKRRLLENSETCIYNGDDEFLKQHRAKSKQGIWVSTKKGDSSNKQVDFWISETGMIIEKGKELFDSSVLEIPGNHNKQNLLMVTAAARHIGLSGTSIHQSLKSFKGVPHRLEKLGNLHGIKIFNDSKATNYESASMGISSVPATTVIIAGGQAKEGNANRWLHQINKKACGIVLFGESGDYLKELVISTNFKGVIQYCENLNQAVNVAIEIGLTRKAKSLILSPACASFDQYQDYEERGEHFRKIINNLSSSKSQFDIN